METAKLLKMANEGRPDQALKIVASNLDNDPRLKQTQDPKALAKVILKRARWMVELDRYGPNEICVQFQEAKRLAKK
jgi:hypothetical protein